MTKWAKLKIFGSINVPIRNGLKAYNKTNPITYEDFSDVISWWDDRKENQYAWKVHANQIQDYNLDIRNPNEPKESAQLSPHEIIDSILEDENKVSRILSELRELIEREIPK